jgi:L-asparaginase II
MFEMTGGKPDRREVITNIGNVPALAAVASGTSGVNDLWDKWLDILAGSAHQSAAERVMLTRWIEGERRDL